MGSTDRPPANLSIGIVGAGIAGLGAAIALRRAGHDVEIFEKSSFKKEIGAAILLTPNGNRVLRRWGFDFEKARPVDFKQSRMVNADTLNVDFQDSFEAVEAEFGERMCSYHRIDLHSRLRDIAEREGATIRLGAEALNVHPDEGIIELRGGEKVHKDFWVLADGCHTHFLPKITDEDIPTVKIGKSVYRWLAPFDKVITHPSAANLWAADQGPGFCTFFNKSLMMVTYPCRDRTLLNCAVFHDTLPEEAHLKDWNADTTHERVLDVMGDCHEAIKHVVLTTDSVKCYTVTQRPPSTKIWKGKMLCVGDTVHHMLPTHAQGACSALEDAGALEILLQTSCTSPSPFQRTNLASRLQLFQELRLPRSATTQILSSTNPGMTMAGLEGKIAEIRKFYGGHLVNWPRGMKPWTKSIREFFYSYNIFEEAEKALKYDGEGLPNSWKWFGDVAE